MLRLLKICNIIRKSKYNIPIFHLITMYAFHQRAVKESVNDDDENHTFGSSLRRLLSTPYNSSDVSVTEMLCRRLGNVSSMEHMVQWLKSTILTLKKYNIKVNYANLAADLYFFQVSRNGLFLRWARQIYIESYGVKKTSRKEWKNPLDR